MATPMEREIRRFLGRVRLARFVGGLCEGLLVVVLSLATVLLALRLCGVFVSPSPWWALLALPALVWAGLGVRRLDFGRQAGAAHLDRRLGLEGLLVTSLERDASAYEAPLRRKLQETKEALPRMRIRPLLARLGVALVVLAIVLVLPAADEPATSSSVVADVLQDYEEKLRELAETGGVREEVREELAQRLDALKKRNRDEGVVPWKDLDTFAQTADHERSLHAARLAKAQHDLAAMARGDDASLAQGAAATSARMDQLMQDAEAAGLLDQLPQDLKERLDAMAGADGAEGAGAQGEQAGLDAATRKQLAAALAQTAGDKLAALQGKGQALDVEALSLGELLEGIDAEALFGKPCSLCQGKDGKPGDPQCPG
ncbi:MAG: hypothetical protein AB7I45_01530 [Planctomycetota bacterium]